MGKLERQNIRKMVRLRLQDYQMKQVLIWMGVIQLLLSLSWLVAYGFNLAKGNWDESMYHAEGMHPLMLLVCVAVIVLTFNRKYYRENISMYPGNNIVRYISHVLCMLISATICVCNGILSAMINYAVAWLISKQTSTLVLANSISVKYVVILFVVYLTDCFLMVAVIEFASVIFRKSKIIFLLIGLSMLIFQCISVIVNQAWMANAIQFYIREDNLFLYEVKAFLTIIVCLLCGYLLEKKAKDSKLIKDGWAIACGIGLGLVLVTAVAFVSEEDSMDYDNVRETADTVEKINIKLPDEEKEMQVEVEEGVEPDYVWGIGMGQLDEEERKDQARVEIQKCNAIKQHDRIKDVYKDMKFEGSVKGDKIYVTSKNRNHMNLMASPDLLLNSRILRFEGEKGFQDVSYYSIEEYYMTGYRINAFLPEEYMDGKIEEDYR